MCIRDRALTGELNDVEYRTHPVFGLEMPKTCPDVPNAVLNPRDTWRNEEDYDKMAAKLAKLFNDNFKKYENKASKGIMAAAPVV